MDSAPRRLGPLAGQVVRPGRGSASWLHRDFSSWGPHRAPGGPFDDWQGLGFPVAFPVGFPVGQSVAGPCRFQARESFVVTTGTKLGSSAPAIKVPKTMETSSCRGKIKLWNGRKRAQKRHVWKNVFANESWQNIHEHPLVFYSLQTKKSKKKKSSGCCWAQNGLQGRKLPLPQCQPDLASPLRPQMLIRKSYNYFGSFVTVLDCSLQSPIEDLGVSDFRCAKKSHSGVQSSRMGWINVWLAVWPLWLLDPEKGPYHTVAPSLA